MNDAKAISARMMDPRSLRSQQLLKTALLDLMTRQALSDLTLRDITKTAGVSYPTFFKHYRTKQDLFLDLARAEIVNLLAAFREDRTAPDWRPGENVSRYIEERRSLWRTLLTTGAVEAMRSEFIRIGRDLAHDEPILGHGFPIDVVSGLIASGIFEIVAWWLGDGADSDATLIADMLETLVIEPALHLRPGYFTSRTRLPAPRG